MHVEPSEASVAIYWDFENIHASLYTVKSGQSYSSPENRYRQQDPIVHVQAIMDFASSVGDIAVNRAYCHWQWFARYQEILNESALDLIQHFPRGMKNGADIRLALDVIENLHNYPHITHVIIVGGDSDYISLSQKVRQSGRRIIGIGVRETTNHFWIKCCNEFKFYKTLACRAETIVSGDAHDADDDTHDPMDDKGLMDARALMLRAIRKLVNTGGENRVPKPKLKQLMIRTDPSFDEGNFGFASFSEFIEAFPDVVAVLEDESGGWVSITDESAAEAGAVIDYQTILRRGKVRPLQPAWWRPAVEEIEAMFREADNMRLNSFEELERRLATRLQSREIPHDEERIHKLRGNLYALRQFRLMGPDGIGLFVTEPDPLESSTDTNGSNGESANGKSTNGNGKSTNGNGKSKNGKKGADADHLTLLQLVDEETIRRLIRYAADPISVDRATFLLHGSTSPDDVDYTRRIVEKVQGDFKKKP